MAAPPPSSSSSPWHPPSSSATPSSSSSSPSPSANSSPSPLFLCCVSLPGPLQPVSLPSSPPCPPADNNSHHQDPAPAPSPLPSSPPPEAPRLSLPSLSLSLSSPKDPSRLQKSRSHVASLLLGRRKPNPTHSAAINSPRTPRHACSKKDLASTEEQQQQEDEQEPPLPPQQNDRHLPHRAAAHSKQISSRHRQELVRWHRSVPPLDAASPPPPREGSKLKPASHEAGACSPWELLKSGEVSALIKQGFLERTQRRLSPGRVSPLQDSIAAAASDKQASSRLPACQDTAFSQKSRISGSPAGAATQPVNMSPLNARQTFASNGCLAASSPPPDKQRSNTLLDMLSSEPEQLQHKSPPCPQGPGHYPMPSLLRSRSSHGALSGYAAAIGCHPLFNNSESSDVTLTLKGKDGRVVSLHLHRRYLIEHSKFFATRLSETWCKQQKTLPYLLEIDNCEDLEIYQETVQLLYCCRDLKSRLLRFSVGRVIGILQVAALLQFEPCIASCLEYLEAAPWGEEEEEKVRSTLAQLHLDGYVAADVLRRLKREERASEEILVRLIQTVIKGKDNKARKEMKALVSKMLRENMSQNGGGVDVSKESLYRACKTCLDALLGLFVQASKVDFTKQGNEDRGTMVTQIAHQADNLQWLLEILLDRHIADDFVKMWAHQAELACIHKQLATMLRFEVSRLTARLCVAIGKGQVLCPVDVRYLLLQTWLPPLVEDFGWMHRCCKGMDKNVVEDGISQTILTLPLKRQQSILLSWFDRFSVHGDDCPNLQRAFEVWWRRTFVRPCAED